MLGKYQPQLLSCKIIMNTDATEISMIFILFYINVCGTVHISCDKLWGGEGGLAIISHSYTAKEGGGVQKVPILYRATQH